MCMLHLCTLNPSAIKHTHEMTDTVCVCDWFSPSVLAYSERSNIQSQRSEVTWAPVHIPVSVSSQSFLQSILGHRLHRTVTNVVITAFNTHNTLATPTNTLANMAVSFEVTWSDVTCGQVWWPILGICALQLTHPKCTHTAVNTHTPWTHTRSSGQPFMLRCPGSSWGFRLELTTFGLRVRLANH